MPYWKWLCTFLLVVSALMAQQTGGLRGTLTDSSGSVIPAVSLTLTSSRGTQRTESTQADGNYSFLGLAPGEYKIHVELPGFTSLDKTVTIDARRVVELPLQLAVGGAKQEVTVEADADSVALSLDPSQNAGGTVVSGAALDALPDNSDDLAAMLNVLAGPSAGFGGGQQVLLDGFSGGQLPPKSAIKEVRMDSNPYSAQYDSLGFGRIEIITKPGGAKLRGNVGLNDSDAYFNSRNPYAVNKADYVNRMLTGTVAGPIGKRASYSLNLNRNILNNSALINADTLDPVTLRTVPVRATVTTPQTTYEGSARLDAQLSMNHTLMWRYQRNLNNRDNNGIGQFSLVSRAYSSEFSRHEVQLTESWVANASTVVETRFSYFRNLNRQYDNTNLPSLVVSGAFSTGGAQVGRAYSNSNQFEFQNNTSKLYKAHSFKFGIRVRRYEQNDFSPTNFGGTFLFFGVPNAPVLDGSNQAIDGSTIQISSLEQYRRTVLFQGIGYSGTQIRALGGGASQFTIAGGNPLAGVTQTDVGVYGLDDWRVKPNITLSLGMRYEAQTNINHFGNFAPRFGIAWSPKSKAGAPPKTVLRVGIGLFYQRVGSFLTLQQARFNGVNQQQFLITNPDFFPNIPSLDTLDAQRQPGNRYIMDPGIKALAIVQTGLTLERTLRKGTTLTANYQYVKATHLSTNVNINSPVPGTYIFGQPGSGVRPYGTAAGNLFSAQSAGNIYEQIAWTTLNQQVSGKVSLTLNYQFLKAWGNWESGPPTNPYNFGVDTARASFQRKHNLTLVGNVTAPRKIQFSPLLVMGSGQPYDLTIGSDRNGDTIANDRPAFATDLTRPSVVRTRFGDFDTQPLPGQTLVPRNYLMGAGMWAINMRVGRTFQVGRLKPIPKGGKANGERAYNVNFNLDVNNVLNHVNQGGFVGNLASPLFGQSTGVLLFRDTSNNRRVQFGMQFNF